MDLKLRGKVALVTGGASGIGASTVQTLVDEGCVVYIGDINLQGSRQLGQILGTSAHVVKMDVTIPREVQKTIDRIVSEHGTLDILVNSAGILKTQSIIDSTIADWDEISKVNLSGVYYCAKAALSIMLKRKYGKIINISSVSAVRGGGAFGNVLYGITKAGVVALTKGLARESAACGVNVNAIAPGVTETPMTKELIERHSRRRLLAAFPMGRFARASEVAAVAAFLASDISTYINGETISVDGGFLTK